MNGMNCITFAWIGSGGTGFILVCSTMVAVISTGSTVQDDKDPRKLVAQRKKPLDLVGEFSVVTAIECFAVEEDGLIYSPPARPVAESE